MKHTVGTIILSLAFLANAGDAHAQVIARSTDTAAKTHPRPIVKPKGPKPISHEISFGFRINTDGWSIFTDLGSVKAKDVKHKDMFYNVRLWQIEFTEKKNPKEYKSNGQDGSSNAYIYGKINNLYALKLGRGYMRMLAGKPDPGSVSIHWLYAGGVSLGMLKPYYLKVYSDPNAIKYDENTKQDFLNQGLIEGSAGFGKGINEIKFVPGVHLKTALHFDFSANRKSVIGVETGVNFEYYGEDIQILANQPATPYFADAYIALQLGKRW